MGRIGDALNYRQSYLDLENGEGTGSLTSSGSLSPLKNAPEDE